MKLIAARPELARPVGPADLERLALLVPEAAHPDHHDPLGYALAYVEHYQHDVLQLEAEREFLYASLHQAWQRSAYPVVVRLVAGLAYVVGRISTLAEAEHILRLGIEACRRIQDRRHLATFLNRLGGLLFAHGKYRQGWRTWHTGLHFAEPRDSCAGLWEPLASFAYIADILGNYTAALQFVDALLRNPSSDDPINRAVLFFTRGFYERTTNHLDDACDDLSAALRLLSSLSPASPPSPDRQLFTMVIRLELARAQGDYAGAQALAETALALARLFSDDYTVATLLIDQGFFTYRLGQLTDLRTTCLRLRDIAPQLESPHPSACCRLFEQHLSETLSASHSTPAEQQDTTLLLPTPGTLTTPVPLYKPLSQREAEVLQLVATGLSNREIASCLVITPATVKKHLEHIYTRLDVQNRTAAVSRARTLNIIH